MQRVLNHLCALSIEDDYNLALVAVGGVVDSWVDKACRPLHFDMPIEDGAPLAVVPHLRRTIIIPMSSSFCFAGPGWRKFPIRQRLDSRFMNDRAVGGRDRPVTGTVPDMNG
jgi:hypothetical protein